MRKGVSKTVENKVKEQNVGFLGMIAATLDTMLSRNMLASKGVIRVGDSYLRRWNRVSNKLMMIRD